VYKILLVEDSKPICSFLLKKINRNLNISVDIASTFKDAKKLIEENPDYFLALLDVHLPDMDDTTMVDFVLNKNIPSIIMTADYNSETNRNFSKRNIVDFVLKESPESLNYIVSLIDRVLENSKTKVLVVDDSKVVLKQLDKFLKNQLFQVFPAISPLEGLKTIEKNPDIKIVIIDYNMADLNGVEFLKIIRRNFSKNKIAVVGISSDESSSISFLKHGANDFIKKPFIKEEFICRINNTAEALENVIKLEEIANTDFLTKVSNRKYFFEQAEHYFSIALREQNSCAVAMIDIDNFKLINDTYGHVMGDEVIKSLAKLLTDNVKGQDMVARFGGEEFVLYLKDISPFFASKFLDQICKKVAKQMIRVENDKYISYTVSIGVATKQSMTLSKMIDDADKLLYSAKQSGKNKIISDLVIA